MLNINYVFKFIYHNDILKLIDKEILSYKDFSLIFLNLNIDNKILDIIKKNTELKEKFLNQFLKIDKKKFLNHINISLKNYYLSYFSLYFYLFIFIYLFEENKKEIYEKIINELSIELPENFFIPDIYKTFFTKEKILKIKKEETLYEVYLLFLSFFNIDIDSKHKLQLINEDSAIIKNNIFLDSIFKIFNEIINKNILKKDFLNFILKLSVNPLILEKKQYEFVNIYLKFLLKSIELNNRNIIEYIIDNNTFLKKIETNIIFPYFLNLKEKELEQLKNIYIEEFNKLNKIILSKKINYFKNEMKKIELIIINEKSPLKKNKYKKELNDINKELNEVTKEKIFNYNYYFYLNLLLKNKNILEKIINKIKHNNLIELYFNIFKEELMKEIYKNNFNIKNKKLIILILKNYLKINKEKEYVEILSSLSPSIMKYFYQLKLLNLNKFYEEIKKNSSCVNCTNKLKNINIQYFFTIYPEIYEKIPTSNKKYLKNILKEKV